MDMDKIREFFSSPFAWVAAGATLGLLTLGGQRLFLWLRQLYRDWRERRELAIDILMSAPPKKNTNMRLKPIEKKKKKNIICAVKNISGANLMHGDNFFPVSLQFTTAIAAFMLFITACPSHIANAKDGGKPAADAGTVGKNDKVAKRTAADKFLTEATAHLADYSFSAAERAKAEAFVRRSHTEKEKLPYLLILAEHDRVFNNAPEQSVSRIGEYVLPKKKLQEWEAANLEAVKTAAKARLAKKKATGNETSKVQDTKAMAVTDETDPEAEIHCALIAPLPPASDWNITADNVGAAVELAACLVAANKVSEALEALAKIGTDFADASRVRAVELAGDLYMRTAAYGDAVTAYDYGINFIDTTLGETNGRDDAGNYTRKLSEIERRLRDRLSRKKRQAASRRDAANYGPDWSLYREATAAEWQERNFPKAYTRYQKLISDYPETVYAEAARCYRLKTLFQLAMVSDKEATQAAANREWVARQAQKLVQAAQKAKVAPPVLRALRKRCDDVKAELQELNDAPHGEKAEKLALKDLEKFVRENETGLYRGEAVAAGGNYYLENRLEIESARAFYAKALSLLDKAEKADAALKGFILPERAASVATPPTAERHAQSIGDHENIVKNAIVPGNIVNRATAPWYLPKIRREVLAHQGLIAYAEGKYQAAAEIWDQLGSLDTYYDYLKKHGYGSGHTRLMWAAQKTPGAIYATLSQMQGVKGKRQRLAVLLGDMHYVNEDPERALVFYRRLLSGNCGQCNKEEIAYAVFGAFACMCWDSEQDEVAFLKNNLDKVKNTRTEPRALLYLGNRIGCRNRPGAAKVYRELVQRYPNTEEAADGCFLIGRNAMYDQEYQEAAMALKKYLTMKHHESYEDSAKEMLTVCKEKMQESPRDKKVKPGKAKSGNQTGGGK